MPAGLGMDDIVRAAMAAYVSTKEPSSSSSRDRRDRDRSSRDDDYDRDHRRSDRSDRHRDDRDRHQSSRNRSPSPDPFSELIRRGTQELGRLVRKFEKKAKHQERAEYDDRFIEELGSDVDDNGKPYPPPLYNSVRDGGAAYGGNHAGAPNTYEATNDYMRQQYMPQAQPNQYYASQPNTPGPNRGEADSYYGTGHTAAQTSIDHTRRQNSSLHPTSGSNKKSKSPSRKSLKMLARGGLDVQTILKHLPMLLDRAEGILGMLDSGSRSLGKGGKGLNYVSALRAAIKLVRALYAGSQGMSMGRR